METLESLNGRTITDKHGRQYSLVMGDMACIQGKIPIEESHRPFVSLRDVLRFCSSPQGVDVALVQAARKYNGDITISEIASNLTELERFELIDKLIGTFMGVSPEQTAGGGGPVPDPLAVKSETGS
jgi:hypothetical protein